MDLGVSPSVVLRRSSADLHRALDQTSVMRHLMADDLTPAMYGHVLQRLHRAHAAVEHAYAAWAIQQGQADEWLSVQVFQRTHLISKDLRALAQAGVDLEADCAEPGASLLPCRPTRSQMLGMAYVVCGAMFGARLIEARLATTLGERFAAARSFFRAGLSPQMPSWSFVRQRLDAELGNAHDLREATQAVRQTFEQFQSCLVTQPAPTAVCT